MVSGLIPSPTKRITFFAFFVFQWYERDSSSSLLANRRQCRLSASETGHSVVFLIWNRYRSCKYDNQLKINVNLSENKFRIFTNVKKKKIGLLKTSVVNQEEKYSFLLLIYRFESFLYIMVWKQGSSYNLKIGIAIAYHEVLWTMWLL